MDDEALFDQLARLLPQPQEREVRDCWSIGEQEAALAMLVSALADRRIPISETTRAQLSVLAEAWNSRQALTPQILACPGDKQPSPLQLTAHATPLPPGAVPNTAADPSTLVLLPWITCTGCGDVLLRAHTREPWGDLSYLADHYLITTHDHTVLRRFPADSADTALASLHHRCTNTPLT
ncbi:hypothetical protein ABT160_30070 [Streptomyces sp. NPDC001941]|uniref:hypothetical protein n=1 Tax=Streptomyces sp. NPDC001941 TaxID=3154659 RepID=UPI0033215DC4